MVDYVGKDQIMIIIPGGSEYRDNKRSQGMGWRTAQWSNKCTKSSFLKRIVFTIFSGWKSSEWCNFCDQHLLAADILHRCTAGLA